MYAKGSGEMLRLFTCKATADLKNLIFTEWGEEGFGERE